MNINRLRFFFLPALFILISIAYWQGISGNFFLFDDFINIVFSPEFNTPPKISLDKLQAVWQSGLSGPLGRGVALLTFYYDYYAAGSLIATRFKLTNLVIHIINSGLVFLFTKKILEIVYDTKNTQTFLIAVFTTSIWALHPINLTNVLYIVQRMNSLSSTWILITLLAYIELRIGQYKKLAFSISLVSFTLGILTKESTLTLLFYIPAIEFFILKFRPTLTNNQPSKKIVNSYLVALILGILLSITYFTKNISAISESYNTLRDFTLQERLLTQFRVVWWYAYQILLPNINHLSLFHDDWITSTSIFKPLSTLFAITFTFSVLAAIIFRSIKATQPDERLFIFGLTWFLSGHILEGSIFPLEMVFEHRNYLPSLGLILALCILVTNLKIKRSVVIAMLTAFTIYCFFITYIRSGFWADYIHLSQQQYKTHPNSKRAATEYANALMLLYSSTSNKNLYQEALKIYRTNALQKNATPHDIINYIRVATLNNQHINDHDIKLAAQTFQEKKNYPSNYAAAVSIIKSVNENKSSVTKQQLLLILDGYLNNQYHNTKTKAQVYGLLAIVHSLPPSDRIKIEESLLQAEDTHPTYLTALDLSKFYAENSEKEKALYYLNKGKAIAPSGIKIQFVIDSEKAIQE